MVKVRQDLSGQKFGRLTVIRQVDDYIEPNGTHRAKYRCRCDCDQHNEIDVCAKSLKSGLVKSCGCLRKHQMMINGENNKKHNEYEIKGNIVYIKLSNCDEHTMVNLDKWNEISYIKELYWHKTTQDYAEANIPKHLQEILGAKHIKLHQLICPCNEGFVPDHKDRNRLNNLTDNLRVATYSENVYNSSIRSDNTSGHTGVSWNKATNSWRAIIMENGKHRHLGLFQDINEAILVYEKAKGEKHNNTLRKDD